MGPIGDELLDLAQLGVVFTRDPYPTYARLRRESPVCEVRLHGLRAWLVTRYADGRAALANPALSNDRNRAGPEARDAAWLFADEALGLHHHMLRSDPPDHTRIRRAAAPAFTASRVARLTPRIEEIAERLVAGFAARGHAELIAEFAFPLALQVIMEVLGVPDGDRAQLLHWSDTLSSGRPAEQSEIGDALAGLRDHLRSVIDEKRVAGPGPGTGLLDDLVQDSTLSSGELLSSAFQLLQGGHVTTLGFIANAVVALLDHPDELAGLRAEPDRLELALDELLRFAPPMNVATVRFTTEPVRLGGVTVPGEGEPVIVALGSLNRDPSRFADPDRLDLRRAGTGHLTFGHGLHRCLGARLAAAEAAVALRVLVTSLPGLTLAVPRDELAWRANPHLRRPQTLPVTFEPGRPR